MGFGVWFISKSDHFKFEPKEGQVLRHPVSEREISNHYLWNVPLSTCPSLVGAIWHDQCGPPGSWRSIFCKWEMRVPEVSMCRGLNVSCKVRTLEKQFSVWPSQVGGRPQKDQVLGCALRKRLAPSVGLRWWPLEEVSGEKMIPFLSPALNSPFCVQPRNGALRSSLPGAKLVSLTF